MRLSDLLAAALAAASLLAAGPLARAAAVGDPAPVVAAERAFAARAGQVGVTGSFLEFMAPNAIIFAPDPVSAPALYRARPKSKPPKEGGTLLTWRPHWAGIARSGDLGFTTGPAEVNGKPSALYFTVWARQPDGSWKWIYDGGIDSDADASPSDAAVEALPAGDPRPLPPEAAMRQVRAAESGLAAAARRDSGAAYRAVLASDARLQGAGQPSARTPADVRRALAARAHTMTFSALGGGASAAGDLAWTYGDAAWEGARGHYVRIWQRRAGAWKLVFDEILPVPPPPAAPKA